MDKKALYIFGILIIVFFLLSMEFFLVREFACPESKLEDKEVTIQESEAPRAQAMMILIEFQQTDGLVNMVNDMKEQDIYGLLMVTPEFVEANAETIKKVLEVGNIEIVPTHVKEPLWDIPYDKQYDIISDMVERIESAVGIEARIISSRYMASDENTIKVAEKLGIEYVMARGTTELAMTVYKPEEYDVKVLSVSNIDTPEFKYGSLCDYSYYERAGNPEDMLEDLQRAAEEEKFFGVSHTYIGGYKERWNDMWHEFWNNDQVDWVELDTISNVDKNLPMWQIPINKNAPYTPEKIRPLIPYEEEENVDNPCTVEDL
ncbi:hypothetical protein JW766_00060 [Candidatus Dojkabacteria bacterium]|nr:hypothetical protein [Candidatus Dojkabacteria bacterium]